MTDGLTDEDREAERQASLMKDQLAKDVASWSKARAEPSSEHIGAPAAPAVTRPARRVSKPAPAATAAKTAATPSKPFSMSYDGVSASEYIQFMRSRGSR